MTYFMGRARKACLSGAAPRKQNDRLIEPIYKMSAEAAADLDAILDYILTHGGPIRADHVARRFLSMLLSLASLPNVGRVLKSLDGSPRKYIMSPWVILYEPIEDGILVTRIYDGRRNLKALFRAYGRPKGVR